MNHTTIEGKAAQTILQTPTEVVVGGRTYQAAPPSLATLMLVSEAISRMPEMDNGKINVTEKSLAIASECEPIAEVAAILILGAKEVTRRQKRALGIFPKRKRLQKTRLYRSLLMDMAPSQLSLLISQMLIRMEVGDFFGLTTFLTGVNLLRPTKVVKEQMKSETTASGQ